MNHRESHVESGRALLRRPFFNTTIYVVIT